MTMAKTANGKDEVAIMGGGPNPLVPLPGARNIRTLSARYIADLQEDWVSHYRDNSISLSMVSRKF